MTLFCWWFGAFVDKPLLVLFGVGGLTPLGLVVYVARRILVDGTDPLDCLGVNLHMVVIKSLLPFFLCVVIQLFGSFPRSQACITQSSTKVWLSPGWSGLRAWALT